MLKPDFVQDLPKNFACMAEPMNAVPIVIARIGQNARGQLVIHVLENAKVRFSAVFDEKVFVFQENVTLI